MCEHAEGGCERVWARACVGVHAARSTHLESNSAHVFRAAQALAAGGGRVGEQQSQYGDHDDSDEDTVPHSGHDQPSVTGDRPSFTRVWGQTISYFEKGRKKKHTQTNTHTHTRKLTHTTGCTCSHGFPTSLVLEDGDVPQPRRPLQRQAVVVGQM